MSSKLNGRVLHIGKFYPPFRGGMEVFLADLIEEQRQQGLYAIGLVHGQPRDDDPSWLHRVKVQTQVLYAPVGLSFPFTLRRLVRQFEPDVLHLHMPNNAVFWALFMRTTRDVPWVVHWQSDVVASRIRKALSTAYALYRPFEEAVLRRATTVIATSPDYLETSEPLRHWRSKCRVIPLGLRPPQATPSNQPTESEWRPGVLKLLSIGRLTYYKGFGTLIEAVAAMPGVQLLIAGGGALQAELEALVRAHSRPGIEPAVKLLGPVDEDRKHRLLQQCDLFCLASRERTEAFGIVLLEAMQHAKPCLVSDLHGSGMPWLVRHAGAGLLVPVDDVAAWRAAIARLQADPGLRNQFGTAGRRAADQHFSIEACATKVAHVYAEASEDIYPLPANRGTLAVLTARNAESTIGTQVAALRKTGWPQVLVVDQSSVDRTAELALAAGADVIHAPLLLSAWGACQTGLRYGLYRGYRQILTLDARQLPATEDLQKLATVARQPSATHDVIVGTRPDLPRGPQRLAWSWFRQISGIGIRHPASLVRLYTHDAMVVCAAREATLLDHEDIGTLLLMHKSRLRIADFPLSPSPKARDPGNPFHSWLDAARYIVATVVLSVSHWGTRRRRRVPIGRADQPAITRS